MPRIFRVEIDRSLAAEDRVDDAGGVRARGKARSWSRAEKARKATVTLEDIEVARRDWRAKTLPGWGLLIESRRED